MAYWKRLTWRAVCFGLLCITALQHSAARAEIQPATGQVAHGEADWDDASPHPLSLTRHYKSQGNVAAGLGAAWSHNWAASAQKLDLQAAIRFGDGSKVFFTRSSTGSVWLAQNQRDSLVETPTGLSYARLSDEVRYDFDAAGRLVSMVARNGWTYRLAYSPEGRLASVTNAFDRVLSFEHGTAGQLTSVVTPDGKSLSYSYDTESRLAAARKPDGSVRRYHYEDSRHPQALTGITDEAGVRARTYSYDALGRAISSHEAGGVQPLSVTYPTHSATTGTLVAGTEIDPAIYRVNIQTVDAIGQPRTLIWQGGDGQVRLLGADSPAAASLASRSFTGPNLPESETDFLGVSTAFSWDLDRQLKLSTTKAVGRPEAQASQTEWHPIFRLPILVTEPGRTTTYTYDDHGNKLSELITDTATGQQRSWTFTYNAQGLQETVTDPRGGVWRYAYDSAGNRNRITDPAGRVTTTTHDAAGRVLTQTEPGGLVTSYSYDPRGRLLSQTRGEELTAYTYTPAGQLVSATLPSGHQVSYSYDPAQRLVAVQDNRGSSITYTLDAAGNRIREEVRDGSGAITLVTARVINNLNRMAALQGATGQSTQLAYDANGELVSQTDPLNQTTRQTLDPLRRPIATTFADNTVATQTWNGLDQLTHVTDPKGVATQYTTNAFGEVMSETSPDIGTIRYTRDANGSVVQVEDAKGQISQIERDALGRPTRIQYAADYQVHFTYDAAGHVSRIEDKSGTTAYERDPQGRILAKQQTVNDQPSNPSSFRLAYTHDKGQLAGITYPSGLKLFYRRNAAGQIAGIDVQEPGGTTRRPKPIVPFVTNLTHTALGQPKAWSWSNGDAASRTFDVDGRMTANEFATYTWDAAGRVTGITQSLWASSTATGTVTLYTTPLTWSAGYDSRNRLTSFTCDGAETRYSYDPNSNRLTAVDKTTSDTDLDGEFDETEFTLTTSQALNVEGTSNRLLGLTQTITRTNAGRTRSVVTTPVAYMLDANGSLTSDGLRDFEYDASGRLSKVRILKDGEAAKVTYLINALGQRVFKSEPQAEQTLPTEQELGEGFITWLRKNFRWMFAQAQTTTSIGTAFIYGDGQIPNWALLGEYDNGSAQGKGRTEYLWLPTEDGGAIPIGIYRNGKFFAIHTDHLGTPRLMTNEQNKPVWQWPYNAFGSNKPTGVLKATPNARAAISNRPVLLKATGATELNLRFPGQYFDEEAGTMHNYFRDYDAIQGRYRQADPIGLMASTSRFAYAESSPLKYADPFGLFAAGIHAHVTKEAVSKHCPNLVDQMPVRTVLVDFQPGSQDPSQSYRHAMCSPGQSASEGMTMTEEHIEREVAKCTAEGLANALHAAQDKHSRSHSMCQVWWGSKRLSKSALLKHLMGDTAGAGVRDASVESELIVKRFKERCGCDCK